MESDNPVVFNPASYRKVKTCPVCGGDKFAVVLPPYYGRRAEDTVPNNPVECAECGTRYILWNNMLLLAKDQVVNERG